jgi:hypothetical protein
MSRFRVMNSSSRRNRAISSALAGSPAQKGPGPLGPPIGNSLLQRFKLQTDTPSSLLNCWALRSPDFNILTASRLNSSSNRPESFLRWPAVLAEMLEKLPAYNISQIIRVRKKLSEPQEMERAAA